MKRRLIFYLLLTVFLLANLPNLLAREDSWPHQIFPRLLFFYSDSCHACHKARQEVMPQIEKEFSHKIIIDYLNISNVDNYKLLLSLKDTYGCYEQGIPTVFIEGKILVGYDKIKEDLRKTVLTVLEQGRRVSLDKLPGINLAKRFLSFGFFAIVLAGLADGINPCAFTVIVFFITFLTLQGYKKKELIIIGLCFILAVFLTYVLIGLGIFRFLYALNKFYLVAKIFYYAIAAFCFILGLFALYDLWIFIKTKQTEGMLLQLPQVIKNRIHFIIGLHYRKTEDGIRPRRHILSITISALVTGFLVSLLEAVCTGQLYLPTITFLLQDTSLRIRALWYLLVYNLMFIVPLFIIFLFALLGATSETFAKFLRRHMGTVKLLMAGLFFILGLVILRGA